MIVDLHRYNKSDFDPASPVPINLQPHVHSDLLYTLTLASFTVYGPSTFAISCLRRAYNSNPFIFQLIIEKDLSTFSGGDAYEYIHKQSGMMYVGRFKRILRTEELQQWFRASEGDVKKRICDAVECGKVEEEVGKMKLCKGCMQWWYCGVECQTRDWKVGGHKRTCKSSNRRAMMEVAGYGG